MFGRLLSVGVAATLAFCVLSIGGGISSMHARGIPTGKLYATTLSVAQEVPAPVGSPTGSGTATVRLSSAGDQITVQLSYTGLTSAAIMAHIHGDASSVPGTNGPILFDLAPTGGTSGTNGATTFAITPEQVALLRSTRLYVNVHTVNNPSGEIRGQLHVHDPVSDTDGDGRADFAVFRPADPLWYVIDSATGTFRAPSWGLGTDVLVPGDYDGDGRIDLAVFRPPEGIWYIQRSSTDQIETFYWAVPGDLPVPGDFDGDGRSDIAVFRPATGDWWVRHADGTFAAIQFGATGDRPIVADFDGDGRSDLAVLRASGEWWVRTATATVQVYSFGALGPTPALVPGDYTGDGRADPAVFDAATGIWRVINAATGEVLVAQWGAAGDVPVAGDYDSDGKTDFATFRPSTGVWFIRQSLNSALTAMPWGINGDLAQPASFTMPDAAPTAIGDSLTVAEDAGATAIDVLANDTDTDAGPKRVFSTSAPANGTVAITGGGTGLSYQPNAGYCNAPPGTTLEIFTYTLAPGGSTATVTVTVNCVDDVPVAVDDIGTVVEDSGAAAVNVLANDTNPDGHTLSIIGVTTPANGTVVITGGGTGLTYQPNPNYCNTPATPDTFTYTLSPGNDVGTVSMTVTCVNDTPVATDDPIAAVLEDSGQRTITFASLLANDTAGPSEATQTLTITAVSNPVGGTVSLSGTDVLFTPTANFNGAASFDYTIQDNGATNGVDDFLTDVGAVTFTITSVNDAPSFTVGANQSVFENAPAQTVVGWATAISPGPNEASQTVAFQITNNSLPGLFAVAPAVSPTGTLTYTPAAGANGVATITLRITDDGGTTDGGVNESPTQQFTISIVPIPDPPVANPDSYQFIGNTTLEVDSAQDALPSVFVNSATGVLANDTDPDSTIAVTGITSPACASAAPFDCATANGGRVLMQTNGQFRYTPKDGDTAASDTFTYSVSDGSTTVTAVVTLNRSNRVWYVKNNATAGGLGRSSDPFDTLVEAQTASLVDDYIFVYFGDGTTLGQNAGFTMKNGQRLIGEFSGLSIPVGLNGNASPTVLVAQPDAIACGGNPCRPMLDDTVAGAPTGVHAFNVVPGSIRGLNMAGTNDYALIWQTLGAFAGAGTVTIADNVVRDAAELGINVDLAGSGANVLDFHNNSVRVTGAAAPAIVIAESGPGSLTITAFNDNSVSGDSSFDGVFVGGAIFDATPGGGFQPVNGGSLLIGTAGNPVGTAALTMLSVTGDLLFTNLDAYAGTGAAQNNAIRVGSTGVFNAGAGTGMQVVVTNPVNAVAAAGSALDLQNVTVNLTFPSLTANGGTGAGVSLNTVAGSITVTGGTSLGVTTPTGLQGITIQGSNATVSFGSATTVRSTTQGILVGTTIGNVSFGNTTITRASDAISLQNNAGGTRSFGTITVTSTANSVTGAGFVHATGGGLVTAGATTITEVGAAGIDIQGSATTVSFANTTVNGSAGTGVNLANNTGAVTFADLDIAPDAGQVPFNATGNTGTISTTSGTISATGANALVIDGPAGVTPLSLAWTSVSTTGCTSAVQLIDASGTVTIPAGTIPSCTAASFVVSGGTVSATFSGAITQANAFPMVSIGGGHTTGTITFQTGTLSATNGSGLQFDNADGVYNFNGTTTLNGGDAGIDILNGSSGTFSFGANTTITNPSGTAFNLSSSNANVTYSGSIADNSGLAVSIDNHDAGTITFQTGTLTSTGAGLSVTNSNGGAVNFNNSSIQLTTGANTAVTLSSNTSGVVNFATGAGSGLDITTTSGVGFSATGGGTVSVTGSGNTINASSATALNVVSTTIGAGGLTFVSIASGNNTAAADPVNGIVLNGTGAGGLTVTGAGGACTSAVNCTGGAIQNTTNDGVSLTNANNVSLTRMAFVNVADAVSDNTNCDLDTATGCAAAIDIQGSSSNISLDTILIDGDDGVDGAGGGNPAGQIGISANGVNGLSLTNSTIKNVGEGNDESGVLLVDPQGTVTVTDVVVNDPSEYGIRVYKVANTTLNMTLTRVTVQNNIGTFGEHGFSIRADGGTSFVLVDDSDFLNTDGQGVDGQAINSAILHLTVQNSTFNENRALPHAVNFVTDNTAQGFVRIHNNSITGCATPANCSVAIDLDANRTSTLHAIVTNNTIASTGIGSGLEFVVGDGSFGRAEVRDNQFTLPADEIGMTFFARSEGFGGTNGRLDVLLEGNTVNGISSSGLFVPGVQLLAGASTGTHDQDVCVNVATSQGAGNNSINGTNNPGLTPKFEVRMRTGTTFFLQGFTGTGTSDVSVASYFDSNNSGTLGGTFVGTGGTNVVNYAAGTCNAPTAPTIPQARPR